MRNCIGLIIVTLFGFMGGCQSVQVSQDYAPSNNFLGLKTYAWLTETQPETGDIRVDNPLLDARIRKTVDDSLSKRGYQKITQGRPDFYISYTYQIRSKIGSDDVGVGVGFGWGGRGRIGGLGLNTGRYIGEYDEGMLVIDLHEKSKDDLLWRGTGTLPVDQHPNPDEVTEWVGEAVEKILSQFPPLPK